jgi:hypothetical protein
MTAVQLPWTSTALVTLANSPLVSPWIEDVGETSQIVPFFAFAGGTSTHSIEGSYDGINIDAGLTYSAPVSGTAFVIQHPYVRWRTVQTVGDATRSNVYLRAKM